MAAEGMVDALRRASRFVALDGCIVDIHPTAARAAVEVGPVVTGRVQAGDAPLRHQAATAALNAAASEGFVRIEQRHEFDFYTYADSPRELAEYIEDSWNNARIDDETFARTRQALRAAPGGRPRVRERVLITLLRLQRVA